MDEEENSELIVSMTTEVEDITDGRRVAKLRFHLADVEAIQDTCIVVPDIGGPPNAYFWIVSPDEWANIFKRWLDAPHKDDVIEEEEDSDRGQATENCGPQC